VERRAQTSLSMGAPLGNLAGGSSTRDLRRLWEWGISLYGHSVKGTWRGGSFTGDPEGYVEEGSGDEHLSIGAPPGNLEGLIY